MGFYATRDPNKQEVGFNFALSGLELWSCFKYSVLKLKNQKHIVVNVLLKGLSNGTTLMQIQSGRTVPLKTGPVWVPSEKQCWSSLHSTHGYIVKNRTCLSTVKSRVLVVPTREYTVSKTSPVRAQSELGRCWSSLCTGRLTNVRRRELVVPEFCYTFRKVVLFEHCNKLSAAVRSTGCWSPQNTCTLLEKTTVVSTSQ